MNVLKIQATAEPLWGRPPAEASRRGFTLIELLVVIAIISLLVSILLPSLNRAKDLANRVVCMSQLRAQGTAIHIYASDWDRTLPFAPYVSEAMRWGKKQTNPYVGTGILFEKKYIEQPEVFYCPVAENNPWAATYDDGWDWESSYMYFGVDMGGTFDKTTMTPIGEGGKELNPANAFILFDSGTWNPPHTAHIEGGCVLYLDNHVIFVPVPDPDGYEWDFEWIDEQG